MTIKKLEEYTQEELIALTEDQITKVIRLEQAKAGVKILYKPEAIEAEPDIKRTVKVYTIPNPFGYGEILFSDLASAEELVEFINKNQESILKEYYRSSNYNYTWVKNEKIEEVSINVKYYYEESDVNRLQVELQKYSKEKEIFEKEMNDFRENEKLVDDIVKRVYSTINKAKEEKRFIDNLITIFAEYKEIANNNQQMAQSFMIKAYPELTIDQQELLGFEKDIQPVDDEQNKIKID